MGKEAFEEWARLKGYSCTVREKQYLDSATRMVDEAWQACAEEKDKTIAELEAVLTKLVQLKHYKELHGKQPFYMDAMPKAWKEANLLLVKLAGEKL